MKTRGESNGSASRSLGGCLGFFVLQGLFVGLSVLLFRLFPANPEEQTAAKAWFNAEANRVAVQVFAIGFEQFSDSDNEAPVGIKGAVARFPSRSAGRSDVRAIDFSSDTLFTLGLGMWLTIVLFAVLGPLKGVGVGSRVKSVVMSALVFAFCFAIRCFVLGAVACAVEPFAVVRYCDPPLRFFLLGAIPFVGILHLGEGDEDATASERKSARGPFAMLVTALGAILGCNGNLSNNTITINVGGGGGDILPYLAILVIVAWSTVRNFRVREKPMTGGRPKKGRQPAFTQKAVAVLCGKSEGTVAGWENGRIRPPLGYGAELRINGGVEFFDWVREYCSHNGVADVFVQIKKGNVAYTEGLTEREKGLVEEYIWKLRQG